MTHEASSRWLVPVAGLLMIAGIWIVTRLERTATVTGTVVAKGHYGTCSVPVVSRYVLVQTDTGILQVAITEDRYADICLDDEYTARVASRLFPGLNNNKSLLREVSE